ncbi:MAG: DUF4935 domain-containing protein [Acetobacteraceae bacterium]|nr:DUF4935 domain-containing protein [Acetobacteraceae bacterium]
MQIDIKQTEVEERGSMEGTVREKQNSSAEPLVTRHVFLDTQVYRQVRHNPANPALVKLQEQIEAHRVVLHTTDITVLEVKRQIYEAVVEHQRTLKKIERDDFRRWREQAPRACPGSLEFDAEALSTELFVTLMVFLREWCRVKEHSGLKVDPGTIFAQYFERKPPFVEGKEKEFPDAFVVEALRRWARDHNTQLYVVTKDDGIIRAADADPHLLPLKDISEVLTRATAGLQSQAGPIAEDLVSHPVFDRTLEQLLKARMKEATYVYTGDLPDGEAYEGDLLEVEVDSWSVVGLYAERISLLLDLTVEVRVEVVFTEDDGAFYDREDGRWIGDMTTVWTYVESNVPVKVLAEVSRTSGEVVEAQLLRSEIVISGHPSYCDDYKSFPAESRPSLVRERAEPPW